MNKLSTTWVAPGAGATVGEMIERLGQITATRPDYVITAINHIDMLSIAHCVDHKTNLTMDRTVALQPYDYDRLAHCH